MNSHPEIDKKTKEMNGWMPWLQELDEECKRVLTIKDNPMKERNL